MLLRRYGTSVHSVTPDFDANAMSEISFRRDGEFSMAVEEFEVAFEKVTEGEVTGTSDGPVQSEAESALLDDLEAKLMKQLEALGEGEVLLFENRSGVDYPKLRDRKEGIIVEGENRLYFHWRVDPPLRLGQYRPTGS